ncbi:MAG: DUF3568 domain-containing protein [Alphaproteobacteria bacterium]|uniref:DUF3568 domain-containing protein n=1 Tax=Candidatus Nitrobium versatile TaxID=2884831 RepID=A0A953J5B9_9BACT|nr:DUF3568 domain-containing protein [Candidatus Nitrobium versatile]
MTILFRVVPFLLAAVLTVQGCVITRTAPPYGADAAVFANGVLQVTYADTVFKTFDASREALQDFNMNIGNAQKDATGGIIDATLPDGTPVHLVLKKAQEDATAVSIRVGSGSEELARAIGRKIEARLRK